MNKSSLSLLASEPYRLFFPAALIASVLGVLMWPLFYAGKLSYYPSFAHARMMIEGFVGGFAMGFLGTAMPKMLSAPALRLWQLGWLFSLYLGVCVCQAAGWMRVGDGIFALMLMTMLVFLGLRVVGRGKFPPPGMVLTGIGLLVGVFGAAWLACFSFRGSLLWGNFAQRLLYQGFVLLPLLGVGSFIFPMILGVPEKLNHLSGVKVNQAWVRKAVESLLVGVLVILTYWVEVQGQEKAMSLVRFILCAVWITKESGWLMRKRAKGVFAFSLRVGILCLLVGMVLAAVLQKQKVALDHSLYIGGFGLITMMVASRVIFGHSGQGHQFQRWHKPVVVTVALLVLTMATRVSADFLPESKISHHVYAALLWVIVSLVWGIAVLPSVRKRPGKMRQVNTRQPDSVLMKDFRKGD